MKHQPPSYETETLRRFEEVLRSRRTINLYLQTPVPEQLVLDAVEAATWAPNHHVTEPWHFYLLGRATIEKCLDLCRDIVTQKKGPEAGEFKRSNWAEKPGWIVVTCQKSDDVLRQQEDYGAVCAAIQNFMLYLWKAGVGSKWTSGDITRDPRLAQILGFDPGAAFVAGLLWFGYPKVTPTQTRRGLDDVLAKLP